MLSLKRAASRPLKKATSVVQNQSVALSRPFSSSRILLDENERFKSWPKNQRDAALQILQKQKSRQSRKFSFPNLGSQPTNPAATLAHKIFNSAYALKYDLGKVERELVWFGGLLERSRDAHNLFVETPVSIRSSPKFEESVKKALNSLPLSDQTKRLLNDVRQEKEMQNFVASTKHLASLMRKYRKEHSAVLTTPTELSASELEFYRKHFINQLFPKEPNATLDLKNIVDPMIKGGYRIVVDGKNTIDRAFSSSYALFEDKFSEAFKRRQTSEVKGLKSF